MHDKNDDQFTMSIGDQLFKVQEDLIKLGDFIITPNSGRNMLTTETQFMAISSDLNNAKQWWMWFGGNQGNNPDKYDFVLNGGGQVYAKDFICTNPAHHYNICEKIAELQERIGKLNPGDDDDDDGSNNNNNDNNNEPPDDEQMPGEGTVTNDNPQQQNG